MPKNSYSEDFTRTRGHYGDFPFGKFCYARDRARHNRPLAAFIESLPSDTFLFDIGCGMGHWLGQALRQGIPAERLVGLDAAADRARPDLPRTVAVTSGDVRHLPFLDGVADAVICNGVIHHCACDPADAFAELVRITRPGGRIFVAVYNRWNPCFLLVRGVLAPLRLLYWHWDRRVFEVTWRLMRPVGRLLGRCLFGKPLDDDTGRTLLADQVMTPHAHLFTKRILEAYARAHTCRIATMSYTGDFMLLTAEFIRDSKDKKDPKNIHGW